MNTGLTSFRALAFFAVFFFHVGLFTAGYLGVQAFFVLSGFLLTPILVEMKTELSSRDFFVNFYGRRALRIFPLYYGFLLLVAIISLFVINSEGYSGIHVVDRFVAQLPWALTYTYNFYHAGSSFEHTHLLSHFWSLAVEEQFYLLWPLLIFLAPQKHLKMLLVLAIALGPVFRLLIATVFASDTSGMFLPRVDLVVYVLPFSHIDAFAIGGFFALYQSSRSSLYTWLLLLFILTVGYLTQYISTGGVDLLSLGYHYFMYEKFIWGYSLLSLFFAFVLVQVRDERFMPLLFNNPWLHYLGKISYGLYVFHFPIIWVASRFVLGPKLVLVSLVLTVIVSALSYELFEKKITALKDVYFPRKPGEKGSQAEIDSVPAVEAGR